MNNMQIPPIQKSLEYTVTIEDNFVLKAPNPGFEFKVENDYKKLLRLQELAPYTQYNKDKNELIQDICFGRFATTQELVGIRQQIKAKGLEPVGLLSQDVIITSGGKFKVVDVGHFRYI